MQGQTINWYNFVTELKQIDDVGVHHRAFRYQEITLEMIEIALMLTTVLNTYMTKPMEVLYYKYSWVMYKNITFLNSSDIAISSWNSSKHLRRCPDFLTTLSYKRSKNVKERTEQDTVSAETESAFIPEKEKKLFP